MTRLREPLGVLLIAIAVAVGVWFIVNPFVSDDGLVRAVWNSLDGVMLVGLAIAVAYNYRRKRQMAGEGPGATVTRGYLETEVVFFVTVGIAILFLSNLTQLIVEGSNGDFGAEYGVAWVIVDTITPIILATTGIHMLKSKNQT